MNSLEAILYTILAILILVVLILAVVFVILTKKEKENKNQNGEEKISGDIKAEEKSIKTKIAKEYETTSIFDFMDFENVRDNMIIQKNGKRFLMVVECQGVNYDLMSEVEKVATEEGFSEFLNTIKEPIQIYIQTRTVNLEKNIQEYKTKLKAIKDDLNLKEYRLNQYIQQENPNDKELKNRRFEVLRGNNLYEYGKDIVEDTEKMSLNKNVLKKKYYIVLKYYYEPLDGEEETLTQEDIYDVAFSNLYTKVSSMISALSAVGIVSRPLNSYELVELLYNAYNRDDSEVFGIDKAIDAGYNEIYIDSQNIIEKKIEALNKQIQLKAKEKIETTVNKMADERREELKRIEDNADEITINLIKQMLKSNNNIAQDIKEAVLDRIEEDNKKGEEAVETKKRTKESTRKRRAS